MRIKRVSIINLLKNYLIILFFFGAIFGLYARSQKSITITYIGETDRVWDVIIINIQKEGFLLENFNFHNYCMVRETIFDEIMDLINENMELFEEKEGDFEYGSFELLLEIERENNYLFLNKRDSSINFLQKLLEFSETKRINDRLVRTLKTLLNGIVK